MTIPNAMKYVEDNWVELWKLLNAGGLVQHQCNLADLLRRFQAETLEGASMVLVQKNGPTNRAASELRKIAARLRAEEKH